MAGFLKRSSLALARNRWLPRLHVTIGMLSHLSALGTQCSLAFCLCNLISEPQTFREHQD